MVENNGCWRERAFETLHIQEGRIYIYLPHASLIYTIKICIQKLIHYYTYIHSINRVFFAEHFSAKVRYAQQYQKSDSFLFFFE